MVSKINKIKLFLLGVAGCLSVLLVLVWPFTQARGQDLVRMIPFFGSGHYKILIFSDYFCPHCKVIDEKAEPLLEELSATGKVKITFIDVPFNRATPMYAKYYLYAVTADPSISYALRVRKALFRAALEKGIRDEGALAAHLVKNKITWKAMNEKSVFPLMSAAVKEQKITHTPTCMIRYSAADVKRYVGDREIWDGLNQLKNYLAGADK